MDAQAMEDKRYINLAVYILCAGVLFAGCGRKERAVLKENPKQEASAAASPTLDSGTENNLQQKVLAFNLEGFSEKGDKQWEIQGESAEAVQEDKIKLDNIVAKTFGEEAQATLSANKGLYDKTKNNVTLEENVKVIIANTPRLAEEYIDFSLGNAALKKQDTAKPEEKKGMTTITCDGDVEFNYEKNKARFSKNVKVISEGNEIDADRIMVLLNTRTKKINKVIALGHVKITRGENISYSDRATYIASQKRVILNGRPRLVFYQEGELEGSF